MSFYDAPYELRQLAHDDDEERRRCRRCKRLEQNCRCNGPGICYCGEFGGGKHTRSALCPPDPTCGNAK